MEYKRQHWIPQGYLKAWCDPTTPSGQEPYVWQFTKDAVSARRKAPKKIFVQPELYTLNVGGERDLHVEFSLGDLENAFVIIRDEKLLPGKPLTPDEHLHVCAFVAAMKARTPHQLTHWRGNWERIAALGRTLLEHAPDRDRRTVDVPGTGPRFSQEDVEAAASADLGTWVIPMIEMQVPILRKMNFTLLATDDPVGFITSDSPCVWLDPALSQQPAMFRGVGLGSETTEVTLPLAPKLLLLLSWQAKAGRLRIPAASLSRANAMRRFYAEDHFVTCSNETRPEWFATE
jgi:hypothetical protein